MQPHLRNGIVYGSRNLLVIAQELCFQSHYFIYLSMLAPNKMGVLTASLVFLGLKVDFNLMEMQFPLSKVGELKDMVQQWLG